MKKDYVLVTAARNEEPYIEKTIQSVAAQTIPPMRWVIVSDNSEDGTNGLIKQYAGQFRFIHPVILENGAKRNFRSKIYAIWQGQKELKGLDYSFIGNLDADVAFRPDYFEQLLHEFDKNPALGIGGGWIYETDQGRYKARFGNSEDSVPGAVQLFRRTCFEQIGGYDLLEMGNEDFLAEVKARMHGWTTRSFAGFQVKHLKSDQAASLSHLRTKWTQGCADYLVGYHPVYEMAKAFRTFTEKPYVLGGLFLMAGYFCFVFKKKDNALPKPVLAHIRKEQREKILNSLRI
jgi:glycosyltransferase involved in cell wall biosynthesis